MSAPTKYPDWATDGTNTIEPPPAKVAAGWLVGERPPSGWFNAWKHLVGLWVRWLDSVTTTLQTNLTSTQTDLDSLESAHTTLSASAARTNVANTFTQPQTINAALNVSGAINTGGAVFTGVDFRISSATGEFNFTNPRARNDWTIPLACSSGETILQPTDGSYKIGLGGATWALKVPHGTTLSNIFVLVNQGGAAGGSYAALMRRSKGVLLIGSTMPTLQLIAEVTGPPSPGVTTLTINCNGHVTDDAYEYAVWFRRAHADDMIGRIALGGFNEKGIRNYG